jgi:hypothetical protein
LLNLKVIFWVVLGLVPLDAAPLEKEQQLKGLLILLAAQPEIKHLLALA